MFLSNDDIIKKFKNFLNGSIYENYSEKELKEICHHPWRFFRNTIEDGSLRKIRVKYFGTFYTTKNKVKKGKERLEERYNNGTISDKDYERISKMLDNYKDEE